MKPLKCSRINIRLTVRTDQRRFYHTESKDHNAPIRIVALLYRTRTQGRPTQNQK